MATQAVDPANSVDVFKVLQNSIALAASRPRVELSQHCSGEDDRRASAIVTRFRLYRENRGKHEFQHIVTSTDMASHSLSTRNTSNVFVSDLCVDRVSNTQNAHNNITTMVSKFSSGRTRRRVLVRSRLGSKRQSVSYSQGREMDVLFGSVDGLSTEILGHLLGADTLIVDVRVRINVDTVSFACNSL